MQNRTTALGRRILGALRNESILVIAQPSLDSVTVCNAATGKGIFVAHVSDSHYFGELVEMIKHQPGYPSPKVRKQQASPKIRHTTTTGVSMGRFIPGNLSAIGE